MLDCLNTNQTDKIQYTISRCFPIQGQFHDVCLHQIALGYTELISCKSRFLFLSFWQLLENILHIYIFLCKTIDVGLLEYQSNGQNSIFTLSIFIKLSYNYSFVGNKIKLTASYFSSYADAFRQLNNI